MKYKYNLQIFTSKRDMYGNVYSYFNLTSNETGKSIERDTALGNGSIIEQAMFEANGGQHVQNVFRSNTVYLPIRAYNRNVKGMKYAGTVAQLVAEIQEMNN